MGYLSNDGNTLNFTESVSYIDQVKKDGVTQFLNLLKKYQNYTSKDMANKKPVLCGSHEIEPIYWGDEVEGHVVELNSEKKSAHLATDLAYFFDAITASEDPQESSYAVMPEYGAWMIETVPSNPYCTINNLDAVLTNLRDRSAAISATLKPTQKVLLTSTFPMLGNRQANYSGLSEDDIKNFDNQVTQSLFIDDRIINAHPRFPTLSQNIRIRRGEKVNIQIPLFIDKHTSLEKTEIDPYPGKIYMDAMAFGMGSSCIQTTFSARNLSHARRLYDQMSVLSPLFLALSASSPIFRGKLAGIDTRWEVISASVDCRTSEERDATSNKYIPKSRYGSISTYISDEARNLPMYNDSKFPLNESIMEFAKAESEKVGVSVDANLLEHLGFLFARDPLVLFEKKIHIDNTQETAHFENIQSTNWNSVRLKPPPSMRSTIGWRFEFRTMESQLTSDENAAFMLLSHIFVRLFFQSDKLNFYMPISKVNENFERQSKPNAVLTQKFYFRINVFDDGEPIIEELSLNEIFFGKPAVFEGLYAIASEIWNQMMTTLYGSNEKVVFEQVWAFLKQRTDGTRITVASWIRNFVAKHPDYKQDSNISTSTAYDLITALTAISEGTLNDDNFAPVF